MTEEALKTVTAYVSLAVTLIAAITSLAKVLIEGLRQWSLIRTERAKQQHEIATSRIDQAHQITSSYLDRALDPAVPLAIRHQLLRFLATPEGEGTRLQDWAEKELERVREIIDETNRAVKEAEERVLAAKSPTEVETAEKALNVALDRQRDLMKPPAPVPVSAAALRAGLVQEKSLGAIDMKQADLRKMSLFYRDLRGSSFAGADLSGANLQGCDLRHADFQDANLEGAGFYEADLRGAILKGAILRDARFPLAHLEGADLTGAILENTQLHATYDDSTKWPENFDPVRAGAVLVGSDGGDSGVDPQP